VLLLVLLTPAAHGREKLQGVFQGSLGYTDNVQGTPDDPPPGSEIPAASPDAFAILSPGVVYAVEEAAQTHKLSYTYVANLYATESASNGYSNRLEWEGFYIVSRLVELEAGASVIQSHHHTLQTLANASATAVSAAFPGTSPFVLARLGEALSARPWRNWTLREAVTAGLQTPIFPGIEAPTTFELSTRLGADRRIRDHAVGVEVGADYSIIDNSVDSSGRRLGPQSQVILPARGRWRHDWSRRFTSELSAGAVHVWKITSDASFWQPTGLALLAYTTRDGEAEVSYRRTVRTDLFLGNTFLIDEFALRGSLPLDKRATVVLDASGGIQDARLIDLDGELATELDVWLVDVGGSWQALDHLRVGLRYQHIDQVSGAELPPLPLSFVRNTIMATATLEYPPDDRMPRTHRPVRRVDREDDTISEETKRGPPGGRKPR
jgi:hypothetical protein